MNDVPLFNFEGKTYDVAYDDNYLQLYVVKDKLSGCLVSGIIPAANDFVAIIGFKNFCDKKAEEKDLNVYQLIRIGGFDQKDVKLSDGDKEHLFDSRDDLQKFIDEAKAFLLAQE